MSPAPAFAPATAPLARSTFVAAATCPRPRLQVRATPRRAARSAPYTPGRAAPAPAWCAPTLMCAAAVKQPLRVIISGAPASGKGTQCALIVDEFDLVHLSTGDMLRAAVAAGTELGQSAKGFMDAGALVPDSLVIEMVIERVQREDCVVRGWLLDGFPRTENQARALDDAGVVPDAVVSLDVDDAMLVERVVGRRLDPKTGDIYHMTFNPPPAGEVAERCVQRSDDTEEKARTRLQAFHRNCAAIEYHYQSKLRHVDGVRSKERVFEDVKGILKEAKKQNDDDNAAGGVTASGGGAGGAKAKRNGSGMPVAEFVRRAEEAYERGYLSTEDVNWSGQARADAEDADGVSSISDVFRRLDVAAGDAAAILMFAFIGHAAHGSDSGSAVADVLRMAAPFLASWFLISPYLGAYKRAATRNVQAAVTSAVLPVLTSTSAGIAIRGVLVQHPPPPSFIVVSLVSTLVLCTGWRGLYAAVRGPETEVYRRGGLFDGLSMVTTLLRRW